MRLAFLFITLALLLALPVSSSADEEMVWDAFTFDLEDLEGDELSEEDVFTGAELYLVDFWASWCRPCSQYLPHLEEMVEEYGESGLKVVIFVVDEAGTISTARSTLEAEEFPFTILFDPEADVKDELGARQIPTTIIFNAEGEELWRHVGYASGNEDEVREQIETFLGGECEEDEDDEEG